MEEDLNYDGEEELVAVIPSQQNWKGIGISLMVILSLLGLVALSVGIITPPDRGPRIRGSRMELSNLTSGIFQPTMLNASWYSATQLALLSPSGSLDILNLHSGDRQTVVSADVFRTLTSTRYSISPSQKWILVAHHHKDRQRQYSVQEVSKGGRSPVMKLGLDRNTGWATQEFLQHVSWTGSQGHALVLVKDNNLFYKAEPGSSQTETITDNGIPGVIFNGVSDWLYRERLLGTDLAAWGSPNGEWLAWAEINNSLVTSVSFPNLDDAKGPVSLRFPQAKGNIPSVRLMVARVGEVGSSRKTKIQIEPPTIIKEREHYYLTGVQWFSEKVFSSWRSRSHDILAFCISSSKNGFDTKQVHLVTSESLGGRRLPSSVLPSPMLLPQRLVAILPGQSGSVLVHKALGEGGVEGEEGEKLVDRMASVLNTGQLRLQQLVGFNDEVEEIYFTAADPALPGAAHLYALNLPPVHPISPSTSTSTSTSSSSYLSSPLPVCISCHQNDPSCLSSRFTPAPKDENTNQEKAEKRSRLFLQECLGPGIPHSRVISAPLGEIVKSLDTNFLLKKTLFHFSLPQETLLKLQLGEHGHVNVHLRLPAGFRDDEDFAFPLVLLMDPKKDNLNWGLEWADYLTSQRDFIVGRVEEVLDPGQMSAEEQEELGKATVTRSLAVLRHLSGLSYVDSRKLGVIGNGVGGYLASRLLAKDSESAKPLLAAAVAADPIADWREYDAFFSESRLGLAKDASAWSAYDSSSLAKAAKTIPSKILYLLHRPGDLPHMHQALVFSRALVDQGVLFKQQIYLEESDDVAALVHMYKSMENHLDERFGPVEDFFRDDYFLASITHHQS